jgi:hypothetical protein
MIQATIKLPTIRSDLYGDTTNDSLLCSTLSRDTTTDCPLYRLSALTYMVILHMTLCCALPCLAMLQPIICGALLCLTMIQATICSTLLVDMSIVGGLVGVPFRRLVGVLVCGLVGVLIGR